MNRTQEAFIIPSTGEAIYFLTTDRLNAEADRRGLYIIGGLIALSAYLVSCGDIGNVPVPVPKKDQGVEWTTPKEIQKELPGRVDNFGKAIERQGDISINREKPLEPIIYPTKEKVKETKDQAESWIDQILGWLWRLKELGGATGGAKRNLDEYSKNR